MVLVWGRENAIVVARYDSMISGTYVQYRATSKKKENRTPGASERFVANCGAGLESESRLLLCCAPVTRDHATHVYSRVHACC